MTDQRKLCKSGVQKRKGWLSRRNWDQKRLRDRVEHLEQLLKDQRAKFIAARATSSPVNSEPSPDALRKAWEEGRDAAAHASAEYLGAGRVTEDIRALVYPGEGTKGQSEAVQAIEEMKCKKY